MGAEIELMLFVVIMAGVPGAFVIGRFMDPVWQCTQKRKFLKKNYMILGVVQKGSRNVQLKVVDAEKDVIVVGTNMWVVEKNKVYRLTKSGNEDNRFIKEDGTTKGFILTEHISRWQEGVPIVYVDSDTLTPIDFFQPSDQPVKSEEVGSTLLAWIFNQYAKALGSIKNMQTLQYIMIIGIVLCLVISYTAAQNAENAQKEVVALRDRLFPGGLPSNGTIIISQPGYVPAGG